VSAMPAQRAAGCSAAVRVQGRGSPRSGDFGAVQGARGSARMTKCPAKGPRGAARTAAGRGRVNTSPKGRAVRGQQELAGRRRRRRSAGAVQDAGDQRELRGPPIVILCAPPRQVVAQLPRPPRFHRRSATRRRSLLGGPRELGFIPWTPAARWFAGTPGPRRDHSSARVRHVGGVTLPDRSSQRLATPTRGPRSPARARPGARTWPRDGRKPVARVIGPGELELVPRPRLLAGTGRPAHSRRAGAGTRTPSVGSFERHPRIRERAQNLRPTSRSPICRHQVHGSAGRHRACRSGKFGG
jgi:hypothetical protein